MKFADLHLHTQFSDGTFTPEELVLYAQKGGLSCIALTDHDTVEGCGRTATACAAVKMEFINGAELTAEHADTEVHILGYFLDTENKALLARIAEFQTVRQHRIHEMVGALNKLGDAAQSGGGVRAGELQIARPAARGPCAGEGKTYRLVGRSI